METDSTADGSPSALRQCWSDIAKFITELQPLSGVILLLCLNTVFGAAILQTLEQPHELEVRRNSLDDIYRKRETMLKKMFDDIMKYGHDYEFNEWRSGIMDELDNFTRSLCTACHVENVAVSDIITNTSSTVWTWPQSIYFATTVVTTIGNSNIVPRTMRGRIVCIAIALNGIPLLFAIIAHIGEFLEDLMAYLYKKIRQIMLGSQSAEYLQVPRVLVYVTFLAYLAFGAALIHALEGWDYFDAFYFFFNTTATICAGDMIPFTLTIFITIPYIIIAMVLSRLCIDYIRTIHYSGRKKTV